MNTLGSIAPKVSLKPDITAYIIDLSSGISTPKEKYATKAKANSIFETNLVKLFF